MIKKKYFLQIIPYFLFIFFLQTISLVASKFSLASINDQFIFGLVLNNVISIIISILFIVFLIFLAVLYRKLNSIWFILIVSASVSNIADRVIYGGVIDYFNFMKFFVFNLSDVIIISGISIMVIELIKEQKDCHLNIPKKEA